MFLDAIGLSAQVQALLTPELQMPKLAQTPKILDHWVGLVVPSRHLGRHNGPARYTCNDGCCCSPGGISDSRGTVQPWCSMTAAMAGSLASLCSSDRAAEGGGAPGGAKGLGGKTLKDPK
jgi:hypothetical protein